MTSDKIAFIQVNPDHIFPKVLFQHVEEVEELGGADRIREDYNEAMPLCECLTVYYPEEYEEVYDRKEAIIECPKCSMLSPIYTKVERYRLHKSSNNASKDKDRASEVEKKEGGLHKFS